MPFLAHTVVTAVALLAAAYLVPGITFAPPSYGFGLEGDRFVSLFLSAIALGVLNALVRPILLAVSLPITCLSLGLFILVINGVILWLAAQVGFLGLHVDTLWSAIVGALVVGAVSFVLNLVVAGR